MFANIYRGPSGRVNVPPARERIALVFSRIAEELGEVAEALGQDRVIDADADLVVKNEMADLAAWIFALANNLQYIDSSAYGVTLADVTWELYPGKCQRCAEHKCVCIRGAYGLELAEKGAMGPSHWNDRTGLANDKALRRYLEYAKSMLGPGNYDWSLIFLDLDNFGAINKTHGHQTGDEVLRVAAERIKAAVGQDSIVFRRGGEEFVVVLRLFQEHALVAVEAIRRYLANKPVVLGAKTSINITASLGVSSFITDSLSSPEHLEAFAEERARQAKQEGKNRVVPAPSKELLTRSTRLGRNNSPASR